MDVSFEEAVEQFEELAERVLAGEQVIVIKDGQPYVEFVPPRDIDDFMA